MPLSTSLLRSAALAATLALVAGSATAGVAAAAPSARPSSAAKPPATHLVTVGSNPYAVAVSQSLGKAFVVNDGGISVVSLLTHRQLDDFNTEGFHGQNSVALVQRNTQGYITNNLRDDVTIFDTETHTVTGHVKVGYGAVDVVKVNTPKGQRAYVLTTEPAGLDKPAVNSVVAIATKTGKVVQRTKLPSFAFSLAAEPGGRRVWVGSNDDGRLWQVDTTSGRVVRTVKPSGAGPVTGLAFAPGGQRLWVSGLGGVSVLRTSSGRTVKDIPAPKVFPGFPQLGDIQLNGSGRQAFVENSVDTSGPDQPGIAAIDTRTYKVIWRVRTGSRPQAFALDRKRGVAYVPNYDDDTVTYFSVPR
jgi:DNA-binding beta-propeller fold protein YncE